MMKKLVSAVALSVAFAMPSVAATVVNGSFEQSPDTNRADKLKFDALAAPGGQNWAIFTSLPGWTTVDKTAGIEIQTDETITGRNSVDAQHGEHYVELDSNSNSAMQQTITFAGTGSYLLSFYYSPRNGDAKSNGIDYSIFGALSPYVKVLSGNISGPSANPYTAVGTWTQITAKFLIKEAGKYNLKFAATGKSDSLGGFVDNVSVAAVPVPAAGFLLFGALGGLVALRRRKAV